MKYLIKLITCSIAVFLLLASCSQEESVLDSNQINFSTSKNDFTSFSNSLENIVLTLTTGPSDQLICPNDSGFIKNGDVEAILSQPLLFDVIITYDTFVQENKPPSRFNTNVTTWLQVPSIVGGGIIFIKKGETRGTAIVCKSQINPFITSEDCKDKSLQLITKKFKFEIDRVTNTDLTDLNNIITINNDELRPLVVDIRCPFVEGDGFIDIPNLP